MQHFTREQSEVESYGPFAFLNPTTRKYALHFRGTRRKATQGGLESQENGALHAAQDSKSEDPEVRAEDVHRLFRSRDNRKGRFRLLIYFRNIY
jgi:hypothetical protein